MIDDVSSFEITCISACVSFEDIDSRRILSDSRILAGRSPLRADVSGHEPQHAFQQGRRAASHHAWIMNSGSWPGCRNWGNFPEITLIRELKFSWNFDAFVSTMLTEALKLLAKNKGSRTSVISGKYHEFLQPDHDSWTWATGVRHAPCGQAISNVKYSRGP